MSVSIIAPIYLCLMQSSAVNHVPAEVVTSIISVEGGRHGIATINKNKTEDLGIMQINTGVWLPLVSRVFFHANDNMAYNILKNDDCFNIEVGTWILRYAISLEHGSLWDGVGRYHSNTPRLKKSYIKKVQMRYKILFKKNLEQINYNNKYFTWVKK